MFASDQQRTLVRSTQTCMACPSQWDAVAADGTQLHLRFRHGKGTVTDEGTGELLAEFAHGDPPLGIISLDDFARLAGLVLDDGIERTDMVEEPWDEDDRMLEDLITEKNQRYKQIIVMRQDLGMRKGKMIAQGAHASLAATLSNIDDPRVVAWLEGPFAKICVRVQSQEELEDVVRRAQDAGLIAHTIIDSGRTEFKGVPTMTCAAIGPDLPERLDPITGALKLL